MENNFKLFRERSGMTQVELSKKSGVPQCSISEIERGMRSPTLATVKKLAKAMNVHPATLI